jgi:hypothetical protein
LFRVSDACLGPEALRPSPRLGFPKPPEITRQAATLLRLGNDQTRSYDNGHVRPTAMSRDTCAVRIKQRYEPIRILRAERVV